MEHMAHLVFPLGIQERIFLKLPGQSDLQWNWIACISRAIIKSIVLVLFQVLFCVCCWFTKSRLTLISWTIAHRLLCPWDFSRQEYQSGLSFPSAGDLPDLGINPRLLHCRQILYQGNLCSPILNSFHVVLSYFTQSSLKITNFRCLFGLYMQGLQNNCLLDKIFIVTRNTVDPLSLWVLESLQPKFCVWLNLQMWTQR